MIMDSIQIFKFLNFLVIVGLFLYIIRRVVVLQVMTLMREKKQNFEMLQTNLEDLKTATKEIDIQIDKQEKSYQKMKDTFQIWQKQVALVDEQKLIQFEKHQNMIKVHSIKKLEALQRRIIIKKEIPTIMQEVTEELKKNFLKKEEQEKYTLKLVDFLEKSNA